MGVPYTTESKVIQIVEKLLKEKADTSSCVHKTGNEDIFGNKRFKGFLLCDTTFEVASEKFAVHAAPGVRPVVKAEADLSFITDSTECPNPIVSYTDNGTYKTKLLLDVLNNADCVHLTGDETVGGTKTFNEINIGDSSTVDIIINNSGFTGQGVTITSDANAPKIRLYSQGESNIIDIRPTYIKNHVGSLDYTYSFPTSTGTIVVAPVCPNDGNKYRLVCQNGVCSWELNQ